MNLSEYMKRYWSGYRAAKSTAYNCGRAAAVYAHAYGLQGKSAAYCAGYRAYLARTARRGRD